MKKLEASAGFVACRPFASTAVEGKSVSGLNMMRQKVELTGLEVVLDGKVKERAVRAGSKVFVKGDRYLQPWASQKLTVEGVTDQFILVPVDEILLFEADHPSRPV